MGVGFPKGLGPFYSQDGSGGAVAEGSVQIINGPWIQARYNTGHWKPIFGEIQKGGDESFYARFDVPQGLVGIPGKFHGGFRAWIATILAREVAPQFKINPQDLIRGIHNFKDSDFDGGTLTVSVEKTNLGLKVSIKNNGHEISQSTLSAFSTQSDRFVKISDYTPTHHFCCVGSCAVASPHPKLGMGLDYSYHSGSGVMLAALPLGVTDLNSRLAFILAGSDDMAWTSGFFKSGGKTGTTSGIDVTIVNHTLLINSKDLLIRVVSSEPNGMGIIPVEAHAVTQNGFVVAQAKFNYVLENNPGAENSVAKRVGRQLLADLETDQNHAIRNLQTYHDILGPNAFHDLMDTAQVPQDRLPQNLRRPPGYKVSCFAVAGLSDVGSRILQKPFFQTENPYRSLSRSADRFASGVFGGVRSTLGMGLYDLLSGKSFNLEQLLTNSLGMLTVGALASSVINPSGFFGFTGHSLLTIGFNHLLSGDYSFSKEEVMTTLVSTLVGGSIEAGAMSGALKALGFAGKTFGRILSSQNTLGQAVETAFTQLTLGTLLSTLGLVSSEATNQAMASFLQIEQPQPDMMA